MPNLYHANFNATEPRPRRKAKPFTFGAASDGAATAIAAELANWTTGQLTSLTKRVGGTSGLTSYIYGSRTTVEAIVGDASGNVWRVQFRNAQVGVGGNLPAAVTAALLGNAYADALYTVTALGSPPLLPNSGNPVTVVKSVSVITKS